MALLLSSLHSGPTNLVDINRWLKNRNIDTNFDLPVALRDNQTEGCRVVEWNGHKVTLISYVVNGRDHLDLFVLDGVPFRGFTQSQTPQFVPANGL